MSDVKKRIERLESNICPRDTKYGVLIHGYRRDCRFGRVYTKNGHVVGKIPSVLEWANGKIIRIISSDSEEGQRKLKELGYEILNRDNG